MLPLFRLNLAATCTAMRQAVLAWFPEAAVVVAPTARGADELAAWLHTRQGECGGQ